MSAIPEAATRGHDILELFHILPIFSFNETEHD